jgi:hypothetical protein
MTFRGMEAWFIVDEEGRIDLAIPADAVKNGEEVEGALDDDAIPILEWYLREIRPRLIGAHPHGHKLADSDFLFPGKKHDAPADSTILADHYRRGVAHVGLDMTLHQARHITAYYILAEDPNALAAAAAVLNISVRTLTRHYAWMEVERANERGRTLMREKRKNNRRHRRGRMLGHG